MVYHYDVAAKRDVLSRTIITADWRYTEWAGGGAGRELYLRSTDATEYHNVVADPASAAVVREGAEALLKISAPKPSPAYRPRALTPPELRVN